MMKFISNHNHLASENDKPYFTETAAPMLVALMQFSGAFLTESINIVSICSLENSKEVIMNFIALGVIAEIDNYYLSALPPSDLKERLEQPFPIKNLSGKIRFWDRNYKTKIVCCIYKIIKIFEVSIYYYFTPFIVLILTYLIAGQNVDTVSSSKPENAPLLNSTLQSQMTNCTMINALVEAGVSTLVNLSLGNATDAGIR